MRRIFRLAVLAALFVLPGHLHAQSPSEAQVRQALEKAISFFRNQVARHDGYVYYVSPDLTKWLGEGPATSGQIWVQPPATPTVGLAYVKAFQATGDSIFLDAATEAGRALVYGQLESGAWTNCVDFDPQGRLAGPYRNGKGNPKGKNFSTLDDGISQTAIRFLMHLDQAHGFKLEPIHEAVRVALDALLAAQFPNGAFPQGWTGPVSPEPVVPARYPKHDWKTEGRVKNYWDMYTLNDGLAGTVSATLLDAAAIYHEDRFEAALKKLGDFLILAQMPAPQPAWAQQYNRDMEPIWARKFEPAAVAGRESQDVLWTLLRIAQHCQDARYLKPVPSALAYLKSSLLPDGQLARYYELQTNKPLYMTRQGETYSLTHDDAELPSHYGWKGASDIEAIDAAYRSIQARKGLPRESPPSPADVARILSSLDDQGRWVSTFSGEPLVGQPEFRPGEQYISSAVFSRNLETLSEYLTQLRGR